MAIVVFSIDTPVSSALLSSAWNGSVATKPLSSSSFLAPPNPTRGSTRVRKSAVDVSSVVEGPPRPSHAEAGRCVLHGRPDCTREASSPDRRQVVRRQRRKLTSWGRLKASGLKAGIAPAGR
jgi:hypothetical protein